MCCAVLHLLAVRVKHARRQHDTTSVDIELWLGVFLL